MHFKRVSSMIMLTIIFVFSTIIIISGFVNFKGFPKVSISEIENGNFRNEIEQFVKNQIPYNKDLRQLSSSLERMSGKYEFDDIYVGDNMLLKKMKKPNKENVNENTKSLINFSEDNRIPVYSVIIPTKVAVKQKALPKVTPIVDQNNFIQDVYRNFSGSISCVDVYPTLFKHQDEYIYYRTGENLTSLGNYLTYRSIIQRLGKYPKELNDFKIKFITHDYFGQTYKKSSYNKIDPDIINIYIYTKSQKNYKVTQNDKDLIFEKFYSKKAIEEKDFNNIILGGYSTDVTIKCEKDNKQSLIVMGDRSSYNLLPFLALHYGEVRFVDIENLTPEQIFNIDINYYGQIIFAYSYNTFFNTSIPSKIKYI